VSERGSASGGSFVHREAERAREEGSLSFVVKIAARGDLLLAAPAFRHLRESRPRDHIVLIVGRSCRDVAEHLPYFDEIRTVDDAALFGRSRLGKLRGAWQMLRLLRSGRRPAKGHGPSRVAILHRDWRYALIAWLARVGERRGFATGGGADAFLTHAYRPDPQEHHTLQYLAVVGGGPHALAAEVPVWRFASGEREAALAAAASHGFDADDGPYVALGFGGGRNVKMAVELKLWPTEKYELLAVRLAAEGYRVVWLGDGEDARRLGQGAPGVVLAGKLSVPQTAAVLSECRLAIANDTMLLHLAGAVGVPAVGIFGPTDPAHYAPLRAGSGHVWLGRAAVPCSPCHQDGFYPPCLNEHRCMRSLSVEAVLARAQSVLRRLKVDGARAVGAT
jgi:ADP-heptose:LPS heptosyltransferase